MVFNNNLLLGAAGQGGGAFDTTLIGNSIWVDGSGTSGDAMTRTWGTESNQDRWIWATWYNPSRVIDAVADRSTFFASGSAANGFYLRHNSTNSTFNIFCRDNAGNEGAINTSESYRDIGSWYHVLVDFDSANATANDRISLYVNGVRVGAYSGTNIGQNNHINTNVSGQTARIAQDLSTTPNNHMQGYLAQTVFLDNKSIANGDLAITDFLDTFTFGTNGSQIVPKSNTDIIALASAAGNNSFCLDYSDSSNIVNDASSKGNNFTPTGGGSPTITSANQSTSTPSNVHSKFNPLDHSTAATITLSNGNRTLAMTTANWKHARTSLPFPDESYCEVVLDARSLAGRMNVGLATGSYNVYSISPPNTNDSANRCVYRDDGLFFDFSDTSGTSYTSASLTDVLQVYRKGSNFYIGINGTWVNSADPDADTNPISSSIPSENVFLFVGGYSGETYTLRTEAGEWTASNRPAAAKAVNTANQTAPEYQGIDYFNAVLYTGDGTAIGSGGKAVTGTGFKPDWVWIKNRDAIDSHALYDAVRGTTKQIETDTTAIETTEVEGLSVFGSDGFTVGSLAEVNTNTENYVSWNWLAGGAGLSNTEGSLTATISVADAGHFSVVSWTGNETLGATIGHGLGGTPEFIIAIARAANGENKPVYHKFMTSDNDHLKINESNAQGTAGTTIWDVSAMSSTLIGLGAAAQSNSSNGMIAYCFRSVPGVCKVGSYEANNNADGPYISTGFKVAATITKPIDVAGSWMILDDKREPENPVQKRLFPNSNAIEDVDGDQMDFYADGFKLRKSGGHNGSGTYLYIAMADIGGNGTLPPIYGR